MTTADLTSTPCRPALAIADSSGGMVASTTAHGRGDDHEGHRPQQRRLQVRADGSGTANSARVAATTPTE